MSSLSLFTLPLSPITSSPTPGSRSPYQLRSKAHLDTSKTLSASLFSLELSNDDDDDDDKNNFGRSCDKTVLATELPNTQELTDRLVGLLHAPNNSLISAEAPPRSLLNNEIDELKSEVLALKLQLEVVEEEKRRAVEENEGLHQQLLQLQQQQQPQQLPFQPVVSKKKKKKKEK